MKNETVCSVILNSCQTSYTGLIHWAKKFNYMFPMHRPHHLQSPHQKLIAFLANNEKNYPHTHNKFQFGHQLSYLCYGLVITHTKSDIFYKKLSEPPFLLEILRKIKNIKQQYCIIF